MSTDSSPVPWWCKLRVALAGGLLCFAVECYAAEDGNRCPLRQTVDTILASPETQASERQTPPRTAPAT